jgi:hypothetical protein
MFQYLANRVLSVYSCLVDRLAAREVHLYAQTAQSLACFNIWPIVSTPTAFSNASTVIKETRFAKTPKTPKAPKETTLDHGQQMAFWSTWRHLDR